MKNLWWKANVINPLRSDCYWCVYRIYYILGSAGGLTMAIGFYWGYHFLHILIENSIITISKENIKLFPLRINWHNFSAIWTRIALVDFCCRALYFPTPWMYEFAVITSNYILYYDIIFNNIWNNLLALYSKNIRKLDKRNLQLQQDDR